MGCSIPEYAIKNSPIICFFFKIPLGHPSKTLKFRQKPYTGIIFINKNEARGNGRGNGKGKRKRVATQQTPAKLTNNIKKQCLTHAQTGQATF